MALARKKTVKNNGDLPNDFKEDVTENQEDQLKINEVETITDQEESNLNQEVVSESFVKDFGPSFQIQLVDENSTLPFYETPKSAGLVVFSNLKNTKFVIVSPGDSLLVSTGIRVKIADHFQIKASCYYGEESLENFSIQDKPVLVKSSQDDDMDGEVFIKIRNESMSKKIINNDEKFAELTVSRYERPNWIVKEDIYSKNGKA